jgi:NCAIR mutase (PurE)-related protein
MWLSTRKCSTWNTSEQPGSTRGWPPTCPHRGTRFQGGLVLDQRAIRRLLEDLQAGRTDIEAALDVLSGAAYEELGFAKVDHHRAKRQGFPEVIYCAGKTPVQVQQIASRLFARNDRVLATRADTGTFAAVQAVLPEAQYHELARAITISRGPLDPLYPGYIAILTGGTSDVPVAEEAAVTLLAMGHVVERVYDVGVAGIHRLLAQQAIIDHSHVIIAVAGMEGALASVVAGLTDRPVIAVPTSTGYGANFAGLAPLLTMLNSCASGVSVVNIDNGFGAGYAAATINRLIATCCPQSL